MKTDPQAREDAERRYVRERDLKDAFNERAAESIAWQWENERRLHDAVMTEARRYEHDLRVLADS